MHITRKLIVTLAVASTALVGSATAVSAAIAEPCPTGYKGVTLEVDNTEAEVCTNLV